MVEKSQEFAAAAEMHDKVRNRTYDSLDVNEMADAARACVILADHADVERDPEVVRQFQVEAQVWATLANARATQLQSEVITGELGHIADVIEGP